MRKDPIQFHFSADDSGIQQKTSSISERMYSSIIHYCMTTTSTYHIPLSRTSEMFCTLPDVLLKMCFEVFWRRALLHIFIFFLNPRSVLTSQGLDPGALKQPSRTVLIVPVIDIPAVVDITVLLLDFNVVVICRYRCRHPESSYPLLTIRFFLKPSVKEEHRKIII